MKGRRRVPPDRETPHLHVSNTISDAASATNCPERDKPSDKFDRVLNYLFVGARSL